MSVLILHELKHVKCIQQGLQNSDEISMCNQCYLRRKRTIEGVRDLYTQQLPHHIYIHRTGNLVQMYSWYFILEH